MQRMQFSCLLLSMFVDVSSRSVPSFGMHAVSKYHHKFHVMGCWRGMLLAYRSEGIPHNMYLSHSFTHVPKLVGTRVGMTHH